MKTRNIRRRQAIRWVRRNRPSIDAKLPILVDHLVLAPLVERVGDATDCAYFRGVGICGGLRSCHTMGEPLCYTMQPMRGWARDRLASGVSW